MFFEHLQTVLEKYGTNKMYVCPDSVTGIPFWRAMGFSDSGKLDLDGQKNIYIKFIYEEDIKILHGKPILIDEWKNALASNDGDEQNFLVCRSSVPVARLRINGMFNKDIARISMLVVSGTNQRQGIGGYAIEFSEKFVKEKGFRKIAIYITEDNIAAQNLYRKYGYTVTEYGEYMTKSRKPYWCNKGSRFCYPLPHIIHPLHPFHLVLCLKLFGDSLLAYCFTSRRKSSCASFATSER